MPDTKIQIGDIVKLQWNGTYHLPKWLSETQAKVIDITEQGMYIVKPFNDEKIRKITLAHISKIIESKLKPLD